MTTITPASTTTTTGASSVSSALDKTEIASNFTTFLQLLTTQLKNQNPLDPLDTNQFTQQLVEFAQVEQQMKSNDQLSSLVALEKSAQATTALAYVGATVVVDGSTAQLTGGTANWNLNVTKPSTATVTIKDSDRPKCLHRYRRGKSGRTELHLEWPRQRRANLARRQLHAHCHSGRREQSIGRHFNRGAGDRGFGRPDTRPATAIDQRAELHARQDQTDRPAVLVTASG